MMPNDRHGSKPNPKDGADSYIWQRQKWGRREWAAAAADARRFVQRWRAQRPRERQSEPPDPSPGTRCPDCPFEQSPLACGLSPECPDSLPPENDPRSRAANLIHLLEQSASQLRLDLLQQHIEPARLETIAVELAGLIGEVSRG